LDTIKKRKDEATSTETVKDLEESKEEKGSGGLDSDTGDGPSPDGALDEPDELRDADPM
jgi:hypothetical protein